MPPSELDKRRFVSVGTVEDPLSAQTWVHHLRALEIPVLSQVHPTGPVDALTSGGATPWWEIFVPEEDAPRARELLEEERKEMLANAEERMAAAEELALQSPSADETSPI